MTINSIFLSQPEFTPGDIKAVNDLMANFHNSNQYKNTAIEKFEKELANFHQVSHAVVLNSGTAAIHLALLAMKIQRGDRVIIPTLTFAATAFPVYYVGATPIFLDVCKENWTLDLALLAQYLKKCKKSELPKAIISVDLFGKSCNYDELTAIANHFEIPILIDAAESLGSTYRDRPSASQGLISVLSFNLNKIITTTAGGALLTNDDSIAMICRKLRNQARDDFHWYEHSEVGYNYRMSPLLAVLGLSQLSRITSLVDNRRRIRESYHQILSKVPGVTVGLDSKWERSNAWLSTVTFDREIYFNGRDIVRNKLDHEGIESRFIWKPLHLQPVFASCPTNLTGISEEIFHTSLCLPSSNSLDQYEIENICDIIIKSLRGD